MVREGFGGYAMIIHINTYSLGNKYPNIKPITMNLKGKPETLRDLIVLCVDACVERQHQRINHQPDPIFSQEELDNMAKIGRIAFGIDWNGTPADPARAVETALQAYEDGLFRVFQNVREISGLGTPLSLFENDTFTFIRLTMLSGSSW